MFFFFFFCGVCLCSNGPETIFAGLVDMVVSKNRPS